MNQRCVYLTCKSMQVWGEDFESDPEYQAGMVEFWCNQTFKNLGPDAGPVDLGACCQSERSCYREFVDLSTGPRPIEGIAAAPPEPPPTKPGPVTRRELL